MIFSSSRRCSSTVGTTLSAMPCINSMFVAPAVRQHAEASLSKQVWHSSHLLHWANHNHKLATWTYSWSTLWRKWSIKILQSCGSNASVQQQIKSSAVKWAKQQARISARPMNSPDNYRKSVVYCVHNRDQIGDAMKSHLLKDKLHNPHTIYMSLSWSSSLMY